MDVKQIEEYVKKQIEKAIDNFETIARTTFMMAGLGIGSDDTYHDMSVNQGEFLALNNLLIKIGCLDEAWRYEDRFNAVVDQIMAETKAAIEACEVRDA